jgi:predicted ABC-type ATPase
MNNIFILGGPNGAGQTTASKILLPEALHLRAFLNADEIARQLSPVDSDATALRAGRLMIERMRELVRSGRSFAFETTCSGKSYLRMLRECQQAGWKISLLFLWLPSADECIRRVRQRVRSGGHAIPEDVIRRRYWAGLRNMRELYLPLAADAEIYDNLERKQQLIASKLANGPLVIHDAPKWRMIEEAEA